MNKLKRTFFLFLILQLFSALIYAQKSELILDDGVKPHKGIDAVYKSFSEGYKTLNPEMVANLYTENAAYLAPENDVLEGKVGILENFRGFFDSVRKDGQNMTISFRILQRKAEKNMAYDVGIYTLRSFKDGKEIGVGQGKFVVVAIKEKDGKWRFQVDGYSGLKPSPKN